MYCPGGITMLAEKLLLNVLITLAPVLLLSILNENKRKINYPIICGLLQSVAGTEVRMVLPGGQKTALVNF